MTPWNPNTWWALLRDAVNPRGCGGCGAVAADPVTDVPLCAGCRKVLSAWRPRSVRPAPEGLPACWAVGEYSGALRGCLLAYKERRRRDLLDPLSRLLSALLAAAVGRVAVLVPIPATAAAVKRRGFDHVAQLCHRVAAPRPELSVATVLRARPRPDSAGLTAAQRKSAAAGSIVIRPARDRRWRGMPADEAAAVILVDDIVTSGATLSAAARALSTAGVGVTGAVTLAATLRRR